MTIKLEAKKSLGQHFLVDPKAHERIVRAVAPKASDVVIEIGPGTGLLTRHLLASPLKTLIAFELDERAVPALQQEFQDGRFEVIQGDFLQADLALLSEQQHAKLRVIGNIPYYITSPIIFKLIDERAAVKDATLLIQKEVAERLTASPSTKEYGIPTVLANFYGSVRYVFRVPAGAFRPVPKVDSAVVQIDFALDYFTRTSTQPRIGFDESQFRALVRSLFAMRRKTVRNNLKSLLTTQAMTELESTDAARFLALRAEAMTIQDFLELDAIISKYRE